jgi:hypothetical protein
MALSPKPVAKATAKPVAPRRPPPPPPLAPGASPVFAQMAAQRANAARAADAVKGMPETSGDFSAVNADLAAKMRAARPPAPQPPAPQRISNVPGAMQGLAGGAGRLMGGTPPGSPLGPIGPGGPTPAQLAQKQQLNTAMQQRYGANPPTVGVFGARLPAPPAGGGFGPKAGPAGGAFGPKGGAFNMRPTTFAGGPWGQPSKAPGMTGQAQPFAGGANPLNRGGSR